MNVKNIEDIYPLTIVKMRFKNKVIIFNAHNQCDFISTAAEDEEVSYVIEKWLNDYVLQFCIYGIGDTLLEAFLDYKSRVV